MTTRTLGGMAAALLAAAGLCRGATSDNPNQAVPAKPPAAAAPAPVDGEWESIVTSFGGSKADTKPSQDVTMQFTFAAEVREINAEGGQRVKKGFVLMRARDAEVIAAKERQRDKAANETEIQGAEQQLKNAEFKFNMLEKSSNFSTVEYADAENAAVVARLQRDQAKKNKIQEQMSFKQIEAQHERYWLEAPFDGIIEEVMVEVGEGVTEQTKVLRVVNTEKMRLDPYANTRETIRLGLKEGSPAWVLIDMPDAPKLVRGKVLYVSPVADSVSQTRRVRVEIDNPKGWPAGTQALVRFVEPGGEWEKYKVQASADARSDGQLCAYQTTLALNTSSLTEEPFPPRTESMDAICRSLITQTFDYPGRPRLFDPRMKAPGTLTVPRSASSFFSVHDVFRISAETFPGLQPVATDWRGWSNCVQPIQPEHTWNARPFVRFGAKAIAKPDALLSICSYPSSINAKENETNVCNLTFRGDTK